jgi:hypothetical protein
MWTDKAQTWQLAQDLAGDGLVNLLWMKHTPVILAIEVAATRRDMAAEDVPPAAFEQTGFNATATERWPASRPER